jgi:hypothetical protein
MASIGGTAAVTINASVMDGGVLRSIEHVYLQNIDHGTPQTAT